MSTIAAGVVRLVPAQLADVPWETLDAQPGRSVFTTRAWLSFLESSQRARPVVARVVLKDEQVGWFTGSVVHRFGARVLGSPLRGWTTSSMGFDLERAIAPSELLIGLRRFAFSELRCIHLELMDRRMAECTGPPDGFRFDPFPGWELPLVGDDEQLMDSMRPNGRRDVRRAIRNGVIVEQVDPSEDPGFAAEYYEQVLRAFARRKLTPTYPMQRVEQMIEHLHPAGLLVLLRARDAQGRPAATGLFPGLPGSTAVFWMGASEPSLQSLLPNEALMWQALRSWRDRGAVRFDFGGGGRYKRKYGGAPLVVPWFRCSRFPVLEQVRTVVQRRARSAQSIRQGRTTS